MKLRFSLIILTIIVALGVSIIPALAQDETESADQNGVIAIMMADGSVLEIAEDGETILLTIFSPLNFAAAQIFQGAEFLTYNYPLMDLFSDWDFSDELTATATLNLGDNERFEVLIGDPTFDLETGALTYIVLEFNGLELDKDDLPLLPEVETGSLMIRLNGPFLNALFTGRLDRLNSARPVNTCTRPPCANTSGNPFG